MNLAKLFLVFFTSFIYGQTHTISGTIVDFNNEPIAIGDVLLFANDSESLVKYTIVDNGEFVLEDLQDGLYVLKIKCLGFKEYKQEVQLKSNERLAIKIQQEVTNLDAVEVVAAKPIFTNKNGNIKVDVENSIFSSIPEPMELMSKLPGVQLTADRESLTIIGKGEPLIYVGNRRVSIEELQSWSIDAISSIEIINNPSSKYEAEGRSVLLVTLKKHMLDGYRMSISETTSFRQNFNNYVGINGSYQKRELTLKANFGYNDLQTWESNSFEFRIPKQEILSDYLVLIDKNDRVQINSGLGLYYQINEDDYFSINTSIKLQKDKFPIVTKTLFQEKEEENNIDTNTLNDDSKNFFSGNVNYYRKLGKSMYLFSGLQYSSFLLNLDTKIWNNYNATEFVQSQDREQKYNINVLAYRFDIDKTFKNTMKLEVGANISSAKANAFTQIQNTETLINTAIDYDYKENTYASYVQLSGNISDKINYISGFRIENNNVKGELTTDESPLVNRENTTLFPKFTVNIDLDSTKSVSFNYGKSIRRPSFSSASSISAFINPFLEGSNNINLKPTIVNEFSTTYQWKKNSLVLSYYKNKNPIYYTIDYNEAINKAIFGPVNLLAASGFNMRMIILLSYKIWTTTNTVSLSLNSIEAENSFVEKTNPYLYFYTNHQFKLRKETVLSFGAWGLTKQKEGIFERNAMLVFDAAISKTFFKKLQCSLRFNDVTKAMNFKEKYTIDKVVAAGVYFADAHEVAFSVKYSFGKTKEPIYKNKEVDENLNRIR